MAGRKEVKVDEQHLQQMMTGDIPIYRTKDSQPEDNQSEPVIVEKKAPERKKEKAGQDSFTSLFLKDNRLSDRRMVYISKDTYDVLVRYISVVSDRKLSIVGYVDNIVSHHIETYKPVINDLYESRIGCKLFKDNK